MTDSWYASETVIKAALNRGFEVVCALKSSRVIYSDPAAVRVTATSLADAAAKTGLAAHLVTVNNRTYLVRQLSGYLKGALKATILSTESPAQGTKYLAHFHPDQKGAEPLSSEAILTHYGYRWPIETFHRNAKQLLGFNDYRLQSIDGIRRYLEILLIAYTVVENRRGLLVLKDPDQPPPTLSDICRQEQDSSFTNFLFWLYDQFQRGIPAEIICQRLAG